METYNESNVSGVTDNITAYLLRSYQAANNRRELWVPTFEECYEYTLPEEKLSIKKHQVNLEQVKFMMKQQ